jgi:ribonuclease HII
MDRYETQWIQRGKHRIAGVDEVGRGALAGPLVCALVILNPKAPIKGLNDSKQLSATKRESLALAIHEKALVVDWCEVSAERIDQINILEATKEAMRTLLDRNTFDHALIDAVNLKRADTTSIIKGDTLSMSIAAASIIAKVTRDEMMRTLDHRYPGYGFAAHKGYGTPEHLKALKEKGVLLGIHRYSFAPVASASQLQFHL